MSPRGPLLLLALLLPACPAPEEPVEPCDGLAPGEACLEAGSFVMGSPGDECPGPACIDPRCEPGPCPEPERGRYDDEAQHEVALARTIAVQTREVSQADWRGLMGTDPSFFDECGDDCPVERISWYEALHYANALSDAEGLESCYQLTSCIGEIGAGCPNDTPGCEDAYSCDVTFAGPDCLGFRLPTEAEWEAFARAGTATAFWGGEISNIDCFDPVLNEIAWYCGTDGQAPHPVATQPASPLGLYDVYGNVAEWLQDCHHDHYAGAPADGTAWETDCTSDYRVARGGGWYMMARACRSANRFADHPALRVNDTGLRLVRTL